MRRCAAGRVTSTSQVVWTIEGHSGGIYGLAVSPDGRFLYSGGGAYYPTVKQWDASSGTVRALARRCGGSMTWLVALQLVRTMKGHSQMVTAVAVAPDGRFVYSCSNDETVKQWDTSNGAVRVLAWRCGGVCDVDGAVAGADDARPLQMDTCDGRIARLSLCVFWRHRHDGEAVEGVQRGGECCGASASW
jgi:hypothetical protein